MYLIIKITSNALVTLVAAKQNCFHEPFTTTVVVVVHVVVVVVKWLLAWRSTMYSCTL